MSNATELLSRALKFLDYRRIGSDTLEKDIKTFLAAEPEAEPGAWPIDGEIAHRIAEKQCVSYEVVQLIAREILRLHPPKPSPARKPMTEEEMIKGSGEWAHLHNIFEEGVRFAEKHHGITGEECTKHTNC